MPKTPPFCTLLLAALFFSLIQPKPCSGAPILELNPVRTGEKIGECPGAELEMDSEISRRILLMQKRYISYDTLKRDLVPCEDPGVSYYNCRAPGVANHYSRGCEVITRCARGD